VNGKGSILLETLLTIVILSSGLTLIIQAMASSLRGMAYVADSATAIMLLENKLFDYLHKEALAGPLSDEGQFGEPYASFRYSVSTQGISSTTDTRLVPLKAEVSWGEGQKIKKLALMTYLMNRSDETP